MFTTREIATLILLGIIVAACSLVAGKSLLQLLKQLASPKLAIPILGYFAYICGVVFLARQIGMWTSGLLGATILWFLFAGLALFMNITKAGEEHGLFRRAALDTVKIGAFLEFFENIHTFNIFVELALLVGLSFLAALQVLPAKDEPTRQVQRIAARLLMITGLILITVTISYLVSHRHHLDGAGLFRLLVLPVWLTVIVTPFLFIVALLSEYELAFLRMRWASNNAAAPSGVKLAVVVYLNIRLRTIHNFHGRPLHAAVSAGSFRAALSALRDTR